MTEGAFAVKQGKDLTRLHLRCEHQNGLLYFAPAEKSWVCTPDKMHVHALAGFFNELVSSGGPQVKEILHRWGIYFRSLPLEEEPQQ